MQIVIDTDTNSLSELLHYLGFRKTEKQTWKKTYNEQGVEINVDLEESSISYPDKFVLGDKTTSNLGRNENLVVLECVDRLLQKGYPADRIELEKTWSLGRNYKGKLDILVNSKDGSNAFLMIECKTFGAEFEKETEKMLEDGGQLFSYWQQDRRAEYLCLYSSQLNLNGDGITFRNNIVSIDAQLRKSGNVREAFNLWNKQFSAKGLFESNVQAYKAEFNALTKKDLKPLGKPDGNRIYRQFLEILRHNIVSDKGNAFNKIFNMFLCKILDEDKKENSILEFQWKEGLDDEESLLGRLNGLYKKGMLKFLNKDVTDYSADDLAHVDDESIRIIIKELRLYKNQEFAFVDVFNKESFLENAKIVIEIVKLLQGWQIRYSHKQQFLGEFFELLLSTGFKQESGQFFTPVPLVRFILQSLPIDQIVQSKIENGDDEFLPHLIDFSCGSGHFLTESMDIVLGVIRDIDKDALTPAQQRKHSGYLADEFGWAKEYIYGIERDYRLAKTSKLAAFLNGDGDAIIAHASGLDPFSSDSYVGKLNSSSNKLNESFDVLVSNPPYAVKGFKRTVANGEELFSLYSKLTDKSNEIEVLFVERMAQLVKPGGVAGVVLPRSILNNGGIYSDARRIIFENFHLKSIVVLGSKAFMATGINTVIMFLRKRSESLTLVTRDDYINMAGGGGGNVPVVTSLNQEIEKNFLGYEFSSRKGNEGIKLRTDTLLLDDSDRYSPKYVNSYILQAMLDKPIDEVNERLLSHIKVVSLEDLFDWDSEPFSNALTYIEKYNLEHSDPSVLIGLNECITVLESGSRPTGGASETASGVCSLGGTQIDKESGSVVFEKIKRVPSTFYDSMTTGHVERGDILICKDGAHTGKCAYFDSSEEICCVNEHLFIVRTKKALCDQKYMFYFMMSSFFQEQVKVYAFNKKAQAGLTKAHFQKIKFPRLPLKSQRKIVKLIDREWNQLIGSREKSASAHIDKVFVDFGLDSSSR